MIPIDSTKLTGFRLSMASQGKQKATIESYGRDLANFLRFLEGSNVSSDEIGLDTLQEFKLWMIENGSKPSSVRRAVISIRMFFRWLEESGELHGNPFDQAPVPGHEQHIARSISEEKIALMLTVAASCDSALKAARDKALLLLLCREGLKTSEIVSLVWNQFIASNDGGKLVISGARARTLQLETESTEAIKLYRQALQNDGRTKEIFLCSMSMFISFKGADARIVQPGITRHGLKFAIYELGSAAQIDHLNAEQLRHVAIGHKISLGFTPDMVMSHLGLRRVGNIGQHLTDQSKI